MCVCVCVCVRTPHLFHCVAREEGGGDRRRDCRAGMNAQVFKLINLEKVLLILRALGVPENYTHATLYRIDNKRGSAAAAGLFGCLIQKFSTSGHMCDPPAELLHRIRRRTLEPSHVPGSSFSELICTEEQFPPLPTSDNNEHKKKATTKEIWCALVSYLYDETFVAIVLNGGGEDLLAIETTTKADRMAAVLTRAISFGYVFNGCCIPGRLCCLPPPLEMTLLCAISSTKDDTREIAWIELNRMAASYGGYVIRVRDVGADLGISSSTTLLIELHCSRTQQQQRDGTMMMMFRSGMKVAIAGGDKPQFLTGFNYLLSPGRILPIMPPATETIASLIPFRAEPVVLTEPPPLRMDFLFENANFTGPELTTVRRLGLLWYKKPKPTTTRAPAFRVSYRMPCAPEEAVRFLQEQKFRWTPAFRALVSSSSTTTGPQEEECAARLLYLMTLYVEQDKVEEFKPISKEAVYFWRSLRMNEMYAWNEKACAHAAQMVFQFFCRERERGGVNWISERELREIGLYASSSSCSQTTTTTTTIESLWDAATDPSVHACLLDHACLSLAALENDELLCTFLCGLPINVDARVVEGNERAAETAARLGHDNVLRQLLLKGAEVTPELVAIARANARFNTCLMINEFIYY